MRLLALTVTAVLAVSITHVAVDLLAWQCRGQQCGAAAGVLGFADGWAPGTRVAVAAVVPVLLLVVLTSLSRRASLRYEAVAGGPEVDPTNPDVTVFDRTPREEVADARHPSLDSPWMWRGESLARRLRILHLSTGFAVVAAAVGLVPDDRGAASVTALVLAAAVVVVGAVLVTVPTPWTRWTTGSLRGEHVIGTVLVLGALVAVALAAVGAWGGGAPAVDGRAVRAAPPPPPGRPARRGPDRPAGNAPRAAVPRPGRPADRAGRHRGGRRRARARTGRSDPAGLERRAPRLRLLRGGVRPRRRPAARDVG